MLHPDDLAPSRAQSSALFAGSADAFTHQVRLRHADGHWVAISVVRGSDGRPNNFLCVVLDIAARGAAERDRDRAAADLAARNSELEAANHLKLNLIGMLGHEIGNPLTTTLCYAEELTDPASHDDDPAVRSRMVHAIDC